MKKRRLLAAAACACAFAVVFSLAGCGSEAAKTETGGSSAAAKGAESEVRLTVFAANSLERALPEVQALYTEKTGVSFADTQFKASGDLVNQLKADSSAADVLITASGGTMDAAVSNGSVDASTRSDMFLNDLVIAAAQKSNVKIESLDDLATDRVASFGLGEPNTVPAGKYAAQALEAAGLCSIEVNSDKSMAIDWSDSVEQKVNAGADKVGTVAQYVSSGQVELGFVYSSDIFRYNGIETVYTVPADMHKAIKYPGAVCSDSRNAEAAADFLRFCMEDPAAQKVFSKYGFELAA